MADLDRYKRLELNTAPLGDVHDIRVNSAATENGLSEFQRFVVKNFFDTQPKRRAAYLRRLGYQMNPKNPEEYRPDGHQGDFVPVEPENVVLGFLPFYNLFSEEGRTELVNDIKDIGFDLAVEGPITGAGAVTGAAKAAPVGAAAGTAVLPGAGTAVGSAIAGTSGAFIGGAGSKAVVEKVKEGIGNFFLDEEVPLDNQELFYQSLVAGGFGAAGKVLKGLVGNWKKMRVQDISDSLKEAAIRKSNGTFNQNLIDDLAENPQKYTPENVKGANKQLLELTDEIFGTTVENPKSTRQLTGGVAREAIDPLNKRADLEIAKLAQDSRANFSYDEIRGLLLDRTKGIANKKFRTQEETKALQYINSELKRLKETLVTGGKETTIVGPDGRPFKQPIEFKELTFKEGRDFLKSIQNRAFEEGDLKGNRTLAGVSRGMKQLSDEKAQLLGSDLATINAQRSKILKLYTNTKALGGDGSVQNAFIGKDSLSKQRVLRHFSEMDDVLDTDLFNRIQTTQFQAAVENLYARPGAFGSGSVMKDMLRGGLDKAPKEAFKFGTIGALGGPATATKFAAAGAAKGFLEGAKEGAALASPETLIKKFTKIKNRVDDIEKQFTRPETLKEAAFQGARSASGQAAAQVDQPLAESALDATTPPPVRASNQTKEIIRDPLSNIPQAEPQPREVGEPGQVQKTEEDPLERFRQLQLNLAPLGN